MADLRFDDCLAQTIVTEMRRDSRIVLLGNAASSPLWTRFSHAANPVFGSTRVIEGAAGEASPTDLAIGLALAGRRPIADLGPVDEAIADSESIVNLLAKFRFLTNGAAKLPVVLIVSQGMTRSGATFSQSLESWFAHVPGLQVAFPSSPAVGRSLLVTAIRSDDPTVYLVDKRVAAAAGSVPDVTEPLPFGQAGVLRSGHDVTIVALGWQIREALKAAENLSAEGIEAEVIDPRTLVPLDIQSIVESIKRTHRLVVTHESPRFAGIGAEIVSAVCERSFHDLDAAPLRVAMPFVPAPVSVEQIAQILPSHRDIEAAVKDLVEAKPR